MHLVFFMNRYGHLSKLDFDNLGLDVAIGYFNHQFATKEAFLDLLVRSDGSMVPDPDPFLIDGLIDEIKELAIYVRATNDVDSYILNHFDIFWKNLEKKQKHCMCYYHMVMRSAPAIIKSRFGQPVALLTNVDDLDLLEDVGTVGEGDDELFGNTYKAYYKSHVMDNKKVFKYFQSVCSTHAQALEAPRPN